MIDKRVQQAADAVTGISDGATVLVGGFGTSGRPDHLLRGLLELGARDLVFVANNATNGDDVVAELLAARRIRKIICSYPRGRTGRTVFDDLYEGGQIELELVPQGTLAERLRAAAAGIGGFFTRTGAGSLLTEGRETREIGGHSYVLESPLFGDAALLNASCGDRWGNLVYHRGARINNPVMAGAAKLAVAQVDRFVELGEIDPEHVVTPGVLVDRVLEVPCHKH